MNAPGPERSSRSADADDLRHAVETKQTRKLEARRAGPPRPWFGLGLFGLVGWSVAIPTLVGIALGVWIDRNYPSRYSWTLMLLVAGLTLGCLQAWFWLQRESRLD